MSGVLDQSQMDSYERLGERIRQGRVVFFVGAGLSLDSERNTASRLIGRLLVRFFALSGVLNRSDLCIDLAETLLPRELRSNVDAFKEMNRVPLGVNEGFFNVIVWQLGNRYYETNDWMCATYQLMLEQLVDFDGGIKSKLKQLYKAESDLIADVMSSDKVPLQKIDREILSLAKKNKGERQYRAGKALFLDTMGFRDQPEVMRGEAEADDVQTVLKSYGSVLKPRHWVMARFARENWCSTLITTNFDRLIEGAYRLSGFRSSGCNGSIPLPVNEWETISSPTKYFDSGGKGRTALIVKIHGCSKYYEDAWRENNGSCSKWQSYLQSMVFTYREIQHWREDGWSRDYLRTMLRTRVMLFAGYSARDPVIHDTLRSVYEEMAGWRDNNVEGNGSDICHTPAYSLTSSDELYDFYRGEVLRSATTAMTGKRVMKSDPHPNLLSHSYCVEENSERKVLDTDDVFLWMNHLAYRSQQLEALRQELGAVFKSLTGKRLDEANLSKIVDLFNSLIEEEKQVLTRMLPNKCSHLEYRRLIGWTYEFQPSLLREFARGRALQMETGQGHWFQEMSVLPNYYVPTTARPMWTAWGALVELALREGAKRAGFEVKPGIGQYPCLRISKKSETGRLPHELVIQLKRRGSFCQILQGRGAYLPQSIWTLASDDSPWRASETDPDPPSLDKPVFSRSESRVPPPERMILMALGEENEFKELVGIPE